jgi:hypothetical protein
MRAVAAGELDLGWVDPEIEWDASRPAELIPNLAGRHSGIWTDLPPYAQVFTMREGNLVRRQTFPDQASALSAVGLG